MAAVPEVTELESMLNHLEGVVHLAYDATQALIDADPGKGKGKVQSAEMDALVQVMRDRRRELGTIQEEATGCKRKLCELYTRMAGAPM